MQLRLIEIHHKEGKAENAKKAVRIAITVWLILLLLLGIMIFFEQQIKTAVR